MDRYEINKNMTTFQQKIGDLYEALQIKSKEAKLASLDALISDPLFWNDQKKANQIIAEANKLRDSINLYQKVSKEYESIVELSELAESDEEMMLLLDDEIVAFQKTIAEAEEAALLSDKYDALNCIVELHPGAGGTESMDWASMLYRMYQRFCQQQGFKLTVLDYLAGEEAGIKSVTFLIKGKNAYGLFKGERGVHRLVRISPFDSGARRHTSFCSCDVAPELEETNDIDVKDEDLKIDVYHSSGAGGQSVNTSNSAVRITHLPTKTVVTCQTERSQLRNKEIAMELLKNKLYQKELAEQEKLKKEVAGDVSNIDFGSQIRSYILEPYKLVKDHRSKYESTDPVKVLDGDIMPFIKSVLKM